MAKKKEDKKTTPVTEEQAEAVAETAEAAPEVNEWEEKYNAEHDSYLRLAADYGNGKADAVEKLLPVYDNLERALNQPTEDEAYKKGVEMTMTQLTEILTGLGVEIFGAVGDGFDPNFHNAVMHIDDESFGENTICQVFQKGFKISDKIVRFAMVQVAN